MAEDQANQEAKIDFTREGEVPGYISFSEASVMALRTARASPARRRWILRTNMVFDVLNEYEDENSYTVVVSFRSEGEFDGTPGQERFKFSKTGRFEDREVLRHPRSSQLFPIKRLAMPVGIIAGCAVIVVLLYFLLLSQDNSGRGNLAIVAGQSATEVLRADITNVSRLATGYSLTLDVESIPGAGQQIDMEVRTTTLSGFATEATTQFIRQPSGIYIGNVLVSIEYIENSSLEWVRENVSVEILLEP